MTIENIYGKKRYDLNAKAVTCDNCGNGFEAESWEDAQDQMKQEGWVTRKAQDKWLHYCGDCKEENKEWGRK